MEVVKFCYRENAGWSLDKFPDFDSDRTAVFVFSAPNFNNQENVIKQLSEAFPQSKMIGCSGAGEIYGPHILDRGMSVAVVRFLKTDIKFVSVPIESAEQSFVAGESLAERLNTPHLAGVFILCEGLSINGSAFVQGINLRLKKDVVVTGGLAGDGPHFKKTWVINNGKMESNLATALGFYGESFKMGYGSKGGWDIFGPERIISKSKDNILYELDDKPALKLYKDYLGEMASGLPATALFFPLQIRINDTDDVRLVRTVLSINEEDQSMTFAGNVPEGAHAQLMRANFDRLIEGASKAAELLTVKSNGDKKLLTVAISCVGRRLVLGERAEEEIEATLNQLPEATEQVGFYSYGEISPFMNNFSCELYNQTMTLATISEG